MSSTGLSQCKFKNLFILPSLCFFLQSFQRRRRNSKRGSSSSLSFSNPWTPLPLFSTLPSSKEGLCLCFAPSSNHQLILQTHRLLSQVCWAARRLCLRIWRLPHGGGSLAPPLFTKFTNVFGGWVNLCVSPWYSARRQAASSSCASSSAWSCSASSSFRTTCLRFSYRTCNASSCQGSSASV